MLSVFLCAHVERLHTVTQQDHKLFHWLPRKILDNTLLPVDIDDSTKDISTY